MLPKFSTITTQSPLVLVGFGKMGKALLKGWLRQGINPDAIKIISPNVGKDIRDFPEINSKNFLTGPDLLQSSVVPSIVMLAVKPQKVDDVAPQYKCFYNGKTLFFSIAAGKNLTYLQTHFEDAPIVRCMPNTPAAIGYGMSAMIGNDYVTSSYKRVCDELIQSVGQVVWLEPGNEDQMNAITAISGSGPAYLFYFVECLYQAGLDQGLSPAVALQLANATAIGAMRYMESQILSKGGDSASNMISSQLRQDVTSPNGTTFAGLSALANERTGLQSLLHETVLRATKRSRELGEFIKKPEE